MKYKVDAKTETNVQADACIYKTALRKPLFIAVIHMQDGAQAIHSAATAGEIEMLTMLIENFGVDPQERAHVCNKGTVFTIKLICIHLTPSFMHYITTLHSQLYTV